MDDSDPKPTPERDVLEDHEWDLEPIATPRLWMTPPSFTDYKPPRIVPAVLVGLVIAAVLVGAQWLLRRLLEGQFP